MYLHVQCMYFITAQSVRQRVVNRLRTKYKTVAEAEAEDAHGLTAEFYLGEEHDKENVDVPPDQPKICQACLSGVPPIIIKQIEKLTENQLVVLHSKLLQKVSNQCLNKLLLSIISKLTSSNDISLCDINNSLLALMKKRSTKDVLHIVDNTVSDVASKIGVTWNMNGLVGTACRAMHELQERL